MIAPLAVSLAGLVSLDFWIGVGLLGGIYAIFALGLQMNVGFTGIMNFGQVGFMAVGAYSMAILVVKAGWSFWVALPAATAISVGFAILLGLSTLRLRADYFAIASIAFAEIMRYVAQNARGLTGGNQGLLGFDEAWWSVSSTISDWLETIGLGGNTLLPLLIVTWITLLIFLALLSALQRSPWGRVLRAIREDEQAAQALGKNAFVYRLQSLAIAAMLGSVAGYFLALNLAFLSPPSFEPLFTFIGYTVLILGGLGSYLGVALGSLILWTVLEATRFVDLPLADERIASLRYVIVGLVLILLMAFRPQGVLGKRQEMVLGD